MRMDVLRLLLLLALLLAGAYFQHRAEKNVKKIRTQKEKLMQYKSEVRKEDVAFMKQAMALDHIALADREDGHTLGSIVVRNGAIVGEGQDRTILLNDPSAHAEVVAIRDACMNLSSIDLTGCAIYIGSQPCPMCLSLIYLTGIEKIFYYEPGAATNSLNAEGRPIYHELSKPQWERKIPEIPIPSTEVREIFSDYKGYKIL
jgi:guanine deaminase